MTELHELSALECAAAVRAREVSPVELVTHALERVERLDAQLGAFVTVTAERALDAARRAQQRVLEADARSLPPLLGVPTAIKDLNQVAGVPTRFGSAAMSDFVAPYDDHVVRLLEEAGAISIGKTATPEFGLPCYTETAIGPPTRTPWDPTRSAGGSSGGAAAAVAGGMIPLAQGSDGGGSIRIPASACGLVGFKPSRGRISRGPVDLDVIRLSVLGPLARTVRDAAAFLDATAAPQLGDHDPLPPLPPGQTYLGSCERDPGRLRIGRFIDAPMSDGVDAAVFDAWEQTSQLLVSLGHEVVDIAPPFPPESVAAFETVWAVGAAGIPVRGEDAQLLTPLTRHLMQRGAGYRATEFVNAMAQLKSLSYAATVSTNSYDVLLAPTLAQLPRPVGWFVGSDGDPAQDFERQKRFTPFTAMFNVTGQPAVSLPLAQSPGGLPIGMMLVGRMAGEGPLLSLAAQLEAARPWQALRPQVW